MPVINHSSLTGQGAVQEIAGVKLDARLGRVHLHQTARGGLKNTGGQRQGLAWAVQDIIIVITYRIALELRKARADGFWAGEIHGGASHGLDFTGWNYGRIRSRA